MNFRVMVALASLSAFPACCQILMGEGDPGGHPRLFPVDAAILENHEARTDLTCSVKPVVPKLEFDLMYHSGYDVAVPLQDLSGQGNNLTAVFRVTPEERPEQPVYFSQKWIVPAIDEETKGKAELHGAFVLGEGRYLIEWLLRDRTERYCSSHWRIAVEPRGKDRQVQSRLARGSVAPEASDVFRNEAPVKSESEQTLNVLVLFHVAPQTEGATTMRTSETQALVSILRRIAQEPRIAKYSLIAFNLDQGAVLYQREGTPQLDFPALGDVFQQLHLGTVEIQRLREKSNDHDFLGTLVAERIARSRPDALIFVGSRTLLGSSGLNRSVKEMGDPPCPVFYLNYNPDPVSNPWRDLIGSLVRLWRGTEYTISKPPDLFTAWSEVMSRMSNKKTMSGVPDSVSAIRGMVPKDQGGLQGRKLP